MKPILKFTYFDTGNTCRSHIKMSTPCHVLFVCTIIVDNIDYLLHRNSKPPQERIVDMQIEQKSQ